MIKYRNSISGQNQNIRIANESFENVAKFKYFRTTLINQNDFHDKIKSRLHSGNACYHSVQNLLTSHLISENLKIKIHKTVILPVVLYGCENWSLTLREEHRLRVSANMVLKRILWPEREKMNRGENCIMVNFEACILRRILLGWLNQGGWGGFATWHAWGRGEVFTVFWLPGPKVRDHWKDLGEGGRITLS
jgi:hypothetical protein